MNAAGEEPRPTLSYGTDAHLCHARSERLVECVILSMFSLSCSVIAGIALVATVGCFDPPMIIFVFPLGLICAVAGKNLAKSACSCMSTSHTPATIARVWNQLTMVGYGILVGAAVLSLFGLAV
ncbi:MAG TPA: hypothetical protein VF669_00210 [Tepidisphaeraceae bacterium]